MAVVTVEGAKTNENAPEPMDVWSVTLRPEDGGPADVAMLDDDERGRADAFGSADARRVYVASHALLRRILAPIVDQEPPALRFDRRCDHCGHPEHGRPRLTGMRDRGVSFNLSHSRSRVLIVVGSGPVGADVEDRDRRPVLPGVVRRCATTAEQAWLADRSSDDLADAFLQLWTRKEAVVKALGLGIVVPFGGFDVLEDGPVVAREGAEPLEVRSVRASGALAAVAGPPGSPVRFHPPAPLRTRFR